MSSLVRRLGAARYRADERYYSALSAYAQRDLEAAMAEIDVSIELFPAQAEYHATLGFFLLEAKDSIASKEAFARALALHPYEMLANYGLGMIAYRDKDWTNAGDYFTKALAAQPQRAETRYYLAMVNHRLGENAQAITWMTSAEELFAKAGDGRENHCRAWLREFARLG